MTPSPDRMGDIEGPARVVHGPIESAVECMGNKIRGRWFGVSGILPAEQFAEQLNKIIAPLLSQAKAAKGLYKALNDIHYCFKNIWALDRKKFEDEFIPRMQEALAAYDQAVKGDTNGQ